MEEYHQKFFIQLKGTGTILAHRHDGPFWGNFLEKYSNSLLAQDPFQNYPWINFTSYVICDKNDLIYSKTCLKWPLQKKTKIGF